MSWLKARRMIPAESAPNAYFPEYRPEFRQATLGRMTSGTEVESVNYRNDGTGSNSPGIPSYAIGEA
jgi:hypothetical protein